MGYFVDKIRDNIWGKYGFPSYGDGSVSVEVKLSVLKKMGYIDNELIKFNSWRGLTPRGSAGFTDVAPYSVVLTYNPSIIDGLKPLKVELYTDWYRDTVYCEIPPIKNTFAGKWISFPFEKNEQQWRIFYQRAVEGLRAMEESLSKKDLFFLGDSLHKFSRSEDGTHWIFEDQKVSFDRIKLGGKGDRWGTLWHFLEQPLTQAPKNRI